MYDLETYERRKKTIEMCKKILDGSIDIIEAIRYIYIPGLIDVIPDRDLANFGTLLEDEVDEIPKGKHRELCSREFLSRMDEKELEILEFYKEDITWFAKGTINLLSKIIEIDKGLYEGVEVYDADWKPTRAISPVKGRDKGKDVSKHIKLEL